MKSTKNKVYQIGKYQSNTYKVSSKHPLSINTNNYTTVQRKGFSDFTGNKNFCFDNQSIIDTLNLAIQNRNYTLVEYIPDTNIVYYDSNLRKYRCYSATLKKPVNNLNLNSSNLSGKQNLFKNKLGNTNTNANIKYNKALNSNYNSKTNNHTQNIQNQYRINKSSTTKANQIQNIKNKYSHSTISNTANNNQYRRINSYTNKTEQNRGLNKYNININKSDINNNNNTYRNRTTSMNQTLTQNRGRNNINSKNLSYNNKTQTYSSKTINITQNLKNKIPLSNTNNNTYQRNQGRNIITNRTQSVNTNQINQGRRRNDEVLNRNAQTSKMNNNINQDRGRSVGVISNRAQTNNIGQINQNKVKIEGGKIIAHKTQTNLASQNNQYRRNANNDNQKQLLLNRVQKSQERTTQEKKTNILNLNQNRKVYQEDLNSNNKPYAHKINQTPIPNNRSIQKDYHLIKDIKDLSAIDLQQELQKLKSPYKNEEIVKDENGEIIQRKEEKTIAIIPGQKIEPKSVIETFEKPTIEIIQNEDGTSQSIIKQTKIITAIENIPIQSGVKDDLQLVKQIITHEYKTLSANKDQLDNDNKDENKDENNEENNEINKENDENNNENAEKNDNENELNKEGQLAKEDNKENKGKLGGKGADTLGEKKGNVKNDKKMRYMDIVGEDNTANEKTQKDNKNVKGNKKLEAKREIANKEINDKNVISGENQKNKIQNKDKNINQKDKKQTESLAQNANKKQETTSKTKNTKTDLPASLAKVNKNKEKSGNEELNNKKSDISKSKDKKTTKEKTFQEANNKELNANMKKGKASEETDLRKPFRKNKNEEKDNNKQLNASENYKIIVELYEKCFKAGNKTNKEKEISKIVEIIIPFGEKEAKDILAKLLRSFPKSSELNQKLLNLIITKIKSNANINVKSKGKQAENKLSLEKEKTKETRSQSQIKSSGKKNNRMSIEEGIAKTEINQRIKLDKNDKFASISDKYGINSSLNRVGGYSINTANIGDLKFDGLFLDISKYQNTAKDKNPFEGPSSFYKFYKVRQTQIKKKINDMTIESKNN